MPTSGQVRAHFENENVFTRQINLDKSYPKVIHRLRDNLELQTPLSRLSNEETFLSFLSSLGDEAARGSHQVIDNKYFSTICSKYLHFSQVSGANRRKTLSYCI